ncbi:pyruvate synthase subunit PorB [Chloroflexota bacterium]
MTENYIKYGKRQVTKEEYLAPGHRACIGCVEVLSVRLAMKALGPDTIVVSATGCMEIVSSQLPWTSWRVPWIHTLFENTAAVASGIESGLKAMQRKGIKPEKKVNVVASAGDGGTSDIGLQALSGALERGHNFTYICWDNEAYMNTGTQRSSATPYGASTTTAPAGKKSIGQVTWKKNMPLIAAAHNIPYVATACPSYPFDLMEKVKKAADTEGPAYVHIFSVCPNGWRTSPEMGIEIGKLAVQTGVFPLYEVENGKYKLSMKVANRKPVQDYLKPQGRFRHLSEDEIKLIQDRTDEEYAKLMKLVEESQG